MTQPAQPRVDLRQQMPRTAEWVDRQRLEYGKEHVNACIKRSLAGEEGWFYALERGHVLGTPYAAGAPEAELVRLAVVMGAGFAGFIRPPTPAPVQAGTHHQGGAHGTH